MQRQANHGLRSQADSVPEMGTTTNHIREPQSDLPKFSNYRTNVSIKSSILPIKSLVCISTAPIKFRSVDAETHGLDSQIRTNTEFTQLISPKLQVLLPKSRNRSVARSIPINSTLYSRTSISPGRGNKQISADADACKKLDAECRHPSTNFQNVCYNWLCLRDNSPIAVPELMQVYNGLLCRYSREMDKLNAIYLYTRLHVKA